MSLDHFDRFFTLATVGLGLLLAGGLNLAFGRSGRHVGLRAVVTLVVCGAMVAGTSALTRSDLAVRAGLILLGVLTLVTLLGSARLWRQLAALCTTLRAPAARWGLVAVGGLGVVLVGAFAFEKADEATTEQQLKELELVLGKPATHPSQSGRAATDRGTSITLREPSDAREPDTLYSAEEKTLREGPYRDHVMRRSGPTDTSNCHGWVFTGGKFHLSPDDVEAILKENGYQEVPHPQPGDLVIYRQRETIAHTAIVRYVAEGQPVLVEGKWGTLGVYMHAAEKSFYGTEYTFYRSARAGHLLTGLGGTPGPNEAPNTTAE